MEDIFKIILRPFLWIYIVGLLYFKLIGTMKAVKAINNAIAISNYRNENLVMFGNEYTKTLEFARLELAEKIEIFKFETYKAFFLL